MFYIVANINSLKEYFVLIHKKGHKALLPKKCIFCGKASPWCHGHYTRKADRENEAKGSLNPVPIFRAFCQFCRRTFSILPECIAPRRWYQWLIQQVAWLMSIAGHSLRYIASQIAPARSTLLRWKNRFEAMFKAHAFHLCSRWPELGRHLASLARFWSACLKRMSLARVMYWLNYAGGVIP